MTQLNKNVIKNLIQLSRIDCTEEEQQALLNDLQKILTYMDQLNEIDTTNVQPCNHVLAEITNVMRDDLVANVMPREVFLSNAPAQVGGMIKVPPVLKQ